MRTAGITYVDRSAVVARARAIAQRLRDAHPEIVTVILFGSFARGRGGPRSDIDLLVVVTQSDRDPRDRVQHYLPTEPWPIDLHVYTSEELERTRDRGLVKEALSYGIRL